MKNMNILLIVMLIGITSGCGPSQSNIPKELIGKDCTIQFNRASLGSSDLVGPTMDVVNGNSISISGNIVKIDSDWIVAKYERKLLYIPMKSILLIERQK